MKPLISSNHKGNKNQSVAIIDLGTNTFHLLIAEDKHNPFDSNVFKIRRFVKLGGDSEQFIGPGSFQRGFAALEEFSLICRERNIQNIHAFGTAMLRNANNSNGFIKEVKEKLGISIQVIDGETEANLIFEGVKRANVVSEGENLIMDIGGGSVEFIQSTGIHKNWLGSFETGVSVLKHRFHQAEPIHENEIARINQFLKVQFTPLLNAVSSFSKLRLVGVSGTFDVIENHFKDAATYKKHGCIPVEEVREFSRAVLRMDLRERIQHPSIPESRADLISVALVLVNFIIDLPMVNEVSISPFSIKEGILTTLV